MSEIGLHSASEAHCIAGFVLRDLTSACIDCENGVCVNSADDFCAADSEADDRGLRREMEQTRVPLRKRRWEATRS